MRQFPVANEVGSLCRHPLVWLESACTGILAEFSSSLASFVTFPATAMMLSPAVEQKRATRASYMHQDKAVHTHSADPGGNLKVVGKNGRCWEAETHMPAIYVDG